jgi:hypothetical protein
MLLGHSRNLACTDCLRTQEFTEWPGLTDAKNIPAASNISNPFRVRFCSEASLASVAHERLRQQGARDVRHNLICDKLIFHLNAEYANQERGVNATLHPHF